MTAPQGGREPGGPGIGGGGEVVLIDIPPITISTSKVKLRTKPMILFCENICIDCEKTTTGLSKKHTAYTRLPKII